MSEERQIELRELTSQDIFPICGILKKVGIKEIKEAFSSPEIVELAQGGKSSIEKIGLNIALDLGGIIVSNLPQCEKELYAFVSSVSGKKVEELRGMSMADFLEIVVAIIKKPEFKDFFSVARRSLR